jgi:hypothetical protein
MSRKSTATILKYLLKALFVECTQMTILMAISLAFGVLFATFIALVLIPAEYMILEDVKRLFPRLTRKQTAENQELVAEDLYESEVGK